MGDMYESIINETAQTGNGEMQKAETGEQMRVRLGVQERTWQIRFNKRFGPYRKNAVLTPEQAEAMEASNGKMSFKDLPAEEKIDSILNRFPVPAKNQENKKTIPPRPPKPESQQASPIVEKSRKPASISANTGLWVTMGMGLFTSMPNMYETTLAMKSGNEPLAWIVTAAFTVAPALLLWAGAREWYSKFCVLMVMGYELFCNATSFYGGLTGLNHGMFMDPTKFLNMATGFAFDSGYEATARLISTFMAISISMLVAVPVIKLSKKQ